MTDPSDIPFPLSAAPLFPHRHARVAHVLSSSPSTAQWVDLICDVCLAMELWVTVQRPFRREWSDAHLTAAWTFATAVELAMRGVLARNEARAFEPVLSGVLDLFEQEGDHRVFAVSQLPPAKVLWFAHFGRHLSHAWVHNSAANARMLTALLTRLPAAEPGCLHDVTALAYQLASVSTMLDMVSSWSQRSVPVAPPASPSPGPPVHLFQDPARLAGLHFNVGKPVLPPPEDLSHYPMRDPDQVSFCVRALVVFWVARAACFAFVVLSFPASPPLHPM